MLLTKAGDGGGGAESTRRERERRPHAAIPPQWGKKCLPLFGENDRGTKKRDGTEMDAKCGGRRRSGRGLLWQWAGLILDVRRKSSWIALPIQASRATSSGGSDFSCVERTTRNRGGFGYGNGSSPLFTNAEQGRR